MAQILAFPVKKELSKETLQKLDEMARTYVQWMSDVFDEVSIDVTNEKELNEITEILLMEYIKSVEKAIVDIIE